MKNIIQLEVLRKICKLKEKMDRYSIMSFIISPFCDNWPSLLFFIWDYYWNTASYIYPTLNSNQLPIHTVQSSNRWTNIPIGIGLYSLENLYNRRYIWSTSKKKSKKRFNMIKKKRRNILPLAILYFWKFLLCLLKSLENNDVEIVLSIVSINIITPFIF